MSRIDKSSEAESSGRLAAGLGEGGWGGSAAAEGVQAPLWGDENVQERESSHACTTS